MTSLREDGVAWTRFRIPRPWFTVPLVVYLGVGYWLVAVQHHVMTDAWSRVGSASYVLFSRDPHLAAIGFVWGPLPPLLMLPLVAFAPLWPGLVHDGLAATLLSAASMAAVVSQVHAILRDLGVSRGRRALLTAAFAAHPMIVLYAGNGMTEALFLLLLLLASRALMRFLVTDRPDSLVAAGVAIAAAYLVRYEALAVGLAVVVLVTARRLLSGGSAGRRASRGIEALADACVVGFPLAAAFVAWAMTSWILVGSPFEQFTSVYGTSSQLAVGGDSLRALVGPDTWSAVRYATVEAGGLEPLLVVLAGAALLFAAVRSDARVLAPLVVFGSVLAFAFVAFVTGKTIGSLRYFITVVPAATLLAGFVLVPLRRVADTRRAARALGPLVVLLLATGVPTALAVMGDPAVGREEWYPTQRLMPFRGEVTESLEIRQYRQGDEIATYLDSLDLPAGAVLVDVFTGFPIVLRSDNPRQFVITSDRDFPAAVSDPYLFGVRYLLVPPNGGFGSLDAIARAHPAIYQLGPPEGRLVKEFGDTPGTGWRLYTTSNGEGAHRP